MTERCKRNPCCGDYLDCNPPPQFRPRESFEEYASRATPSSPVSAHSPAGGVREALAAFDNLLRYGARANCDQALRVADGTMFRFDDRSAFFLSDIDRDCIRAALSSPATPEPAAADNVACQGAASIAAEQVASTKHVSIPSEPVSAPATGEVAVDAAALDQWAYEWVKRLHPETDERKTFRDGYFSGAIHVLGELRNKLCAARSNAPGHGEGGL